jgi:hypothetical protein
MNEQGAGRSNHYNLVMPGEVEAPLEKLEVLRLRFALAKLDSD